MYKYIGSKSLINDEFIGLGWTNIVELIQINKIGQNDYQFNTNLEFLYLTSCISEGENILDVNKNTSFLLRHQFIEFLIRVAFELYYRNRKVKTASEAISIFFFNDKIMDFFQQIDTA